MKLALRLFCAGCKDWKPERDFGANRARANGRTRLCLSCHREQSANWNRKNRTRRLQIGRKYALRKKYAITLKDYEAMLAAQNGVCAICQRKETHKYKALRVDHNHQTGQIRALLCDQCNHLIGNCNESPEVLLAAIAYLEKFR